MRSLIAAGTLAVAATLAVSHAAEAAPILTLVTNPVDFGNVRVGTTGTAAVTVKNTNSPGGMNNCAVRLCVTLGSAAGEFAPGTALNSGTLNGGHSVSRDYNYSPTARGADTQSVSVTSLSSGVSSTSVTLQGKGVGPVFASSVSPGDTIDFGTVIPGTDPIDVILSLGNYTTDLGLSLDLTGLTLTGISGLEGTQFSLLGPFSPVTLALGEVLELVLRYTPTNVENGSYGTTFTVFTDEGAARGGQGQSFTFNLFGGTSTFPIVQTPAIRSTDAPEPATLGLVAFSVAGLAFARRSRA